PVTASWRTRSPNSWIANLARSNSLAGKHSTGCIVHARSVSMRCLLATFAGVVWCTTAVSAQTADELIAKNLEAKGGLSRIKAIKSVRMTGRLQQGDFT